MDAFNLVIGLAALLVGGEFLVGGAAALALSFRVAPVIVGVLIVGFGTSTPELLASVEAARTGAAGVAVGNVVGSNIANILLILGLGAVIAPIAAPAEGRLRDLLWLGAATLLALGACLAGEIGRGIGAVLLAALAVYVAMILRAARTAEAPEIAPRLGRRGAVLRLVGGLALMLFGADRLVAGAVGLATAFGVDEALIGLTVVAVGTSLPELAATIAAARRGATAMAYGNILGSNIFNALGILGAAAMVAPLTTPAIILGFDVWAMTAATAVFAALALTGGIGRLAGAGLLAGYAAWLWAAA